MANPLGEMVLLAAGGRFEAHTRHARARKYVFSGMGCGMGGVASPASLSSSRLVLELPVIW